MNKLKYPSMVVVDEKIIEVNTNDLFQYYLDRDIDDFIHSRSISED